MATTTTTTGKKNTNTRTNTTARNTAPTITVKTPKTVTNDMIATRAYEIYRSGKGGTAQDHWYQAERELKSQR